ncbi:LysR family transcriptional regulator [Streptomyces sp. A7024]|uniref:LysR family transcriptional regulator n=1 Tax=Streptomyces coryli TaxID=1128680 RepID=A0A6G4U9X8_9ACTN|nr:LysR family transcriptional regulator [Streptomyces coryli]NGN68530.1 LysR family transcriptional regulator [Streptomyces coryli]
MDLMLLRTFVAVHRAGSLTRAATHLGLSQPAVTAQIRSLERQLGKPLFVRGARGVTPTTLGDELAHKAAPHLDALLSITGAGRDEQGPPSSLHLAGPPEFVSERVLPALAPLVAEGYALRTWLGRDEEALAGLAAGHHDLAVTATRPHGRTFSATPLWDEEQLLVAAEPWAGFPVDEVPVVEVHESLPFVRRYWAEVYDTKPTAPGAIVVPDLRAALRCAIAGAGLAVLPRYLCAQALAQGEVVAMERHPEPPLRTYFLSVRAGTLGQPHLARAHEQLLTAATEW